jgi:hypothetical protein
MRANRGIPLYRAIFGLGFVVLGAFTAYGVLTSRAQGNKVLGVMLAIVMIALGGVRIGQYLRARRGPPA